MIICRTCQHQEVEGALFCSECGTPLQVMTTQNVYTDGMGGKTFEAPPPKRDAVLASGPMVLQVLDGGQLIPLSERKEYTMGRVSEGQIIMPDIDLTDHRAYECGVSRLHAVLKRKDGKAIIMDLGSSNGTYVDGTRLKPESEHALSHGCILSLGKLKIQFLLQE